MSQKVNYNGRKTSLVYLELLNVSRGETITYGELARRIGCGSAQAVGQALRHNPFAPEVPCHRVIAADGSLCGFCGSRTPEALARKHALLDKERHYKNLVALWG